MRFRYTSPSPGVAMKALMEKHIVEFGLRFKLTDLINIAGNIIDGMPKSQARIYFDKAGVVIAGSPQAKQTVVKTIQKMGLDASSFYKSTLEHIPELKNPLIMPKIGTYLQNARSTIENLMMHDKMDPTKRSILTTLLDELLKRGPIMELVHAYMTACAEAAKEENPNLNEDELLGVFLSSSGPTLIKIIQMLGNDPTRPKNDANDTRIANLTKRVFTATPGISESDLNVLWKSVEPLRSKVESVNASALGVASIGEVHLANMKDGTKKVLKFIRPLAAFAFPVECALLAANILPNLAWQQSDGSASKGGLGDLLVNMTSGMFAEFNLKTEEKWSQTLGREYETTSKGFVHCAKTLFTSGGGSWQCSIQELATGQSVKAFLASNPAPEAMDKLKGLLTELADVWSGAAFRGSKSFHADLHPGNIFVSDDMSYLTVIDFGAAETLTRADHCRIIKMVMQFFMQRLNPTSSNGISGISKEISNFCTLKPETMPVINDVVRTHFAEEGKEVILTKVIQDVFTKLPDVGTCSRMTIVQYVRGSDLLDGVLKMAGAESIENIVMQRTLSRFRIATLSQAIITLVPDSCPRVA